MPLVAPPMGGGRHRRSASSASETGSLYLRCSSGSAATPARSSTLAKLACSSDASAHAARRPGSAAWTDSLARAPSAALPRTVRGSNARFVKIAGCT